MGLTHELTCLTADLPGIGGRIRQRPEDFLVEEQPFGELSGQGEHVYLYIEKTRRTTSDLVRQVGKAFHVSPRDVGYAGLKDKHAITRQLVSVTLAGTSTAGGPDYTADEQAAFEDKAVGKLERSPGVKVLWKTRHHRKLRRGMHGGNRFVIRVRDVEPTAVLTARKTLDTLAQRGVPNYFGDQRYGYRQNSHTLGRLLLKADWQGFLDEFLAIGDHDDAPEIEAMRQGRELYEAGDYEAALEKWPRHLRFDRQALDALRQGKSAVEAVATIDAGQREFLINAAQSAVFNEVLDWRLREGLFDQLVEGDLAWHAESKNATAVDADRAADPATAQALARFELAPTGPMWGPDMTWARGRIQEIEEHYLTRFGLSKDDLAGPRDADGRLIKLPGDRAVMRAEGSRRPMRIELVDPDIAGGVDEHGPYVKLAFELRRGAFATMVLREVMKVDMHQAQQRRPETGPVDATEDAHDEDRD